jgi:hypothetical protein
MIRLLTSTWASQTLGADSSTEVYHNIGQEGHEGHEGHDKNLEIIPQSKCYQHLTLP